VVGMLALTSGYGARATRSRIGCQFTRPHVPRGAHTARREPSRAILLALTSRAGKRSLLADRTPRSAITNRRYDSGGRPLGAGSSGLEVGLFRVTFGVGSV